MPHDDDDASLKRVTDPTEEYIFTGRKSGVSKKVRFRGQVFFSIAMCENMRKWVGENSSIAIVSSRAEARRH